MNFLPLLAEGVVTAVDVGANRGLYARRLAKLCPRVIACEPQPGLASRLVAATPANVIVLPVALSHTAGETSFRIPLVGSVPAHTRGTLDAGDGRAGEEVSTITVLRLRLDDLELERVGFMKIDVEGHELDVLHGAADTIERWRPRLLVECEVDTGAHPDHVAKHLAPLAYEGWFHFDGAILPVAEFERDRHQAERKLVASPHLPARATNFLFLPSPDNAAIVSSLKRLA